MRLCVRDALSLARAQLHDSKSLRMLAEQSATEIETTLRRRVLYLEIWKKVCGA